VPSFAQQRFNVVRSFRIYRSVGLACIQQCLLFCICYVSQTKQEFSIIYSCLRSFYTGEYAERGQWSISFALLWQAGFLSWDKTKMFYVRRGLGIVGIHEGREFPQMPEWPSFGEIILWNHWNSLGSYQHQSLQTRTWQAYYRARNDDILHLIAEASLAYMYVPKLC